MPQPSLTLFGIPSLSLDGQPSPEVSSHRKDLALLAYLTLEPGRHTRDELATLLWGDSSDAKARASLRQALSRLRATIGERLAADRSTVSLIDPIACDAVAFLAAVDDDARGASEYQVSRFLSGFIIKRAPAFDEWVAGKRQQLLRRHQEVMLTVARDAMSRWRWQEAARSADRILDLDPLSDDAARIAAEAWYMAGDRGEALERCARHEAALADELHAEPGAAFNALKAQIAAETDPIPDRPISNEWRVRPPTLAPPLVGRESAWQCLTDRWHRSEDDVGQIVVLEGPVGVGKTRLADEFSRWARTKGATVLFGRGNGLDGGIPYGPIAEAIQDALTAPGLVGTPPEWLTEVARLLPDLRRRFVDLPAPADPHDGAEQWRLFEGVGQVGLALAAERPVMVVLDSLEQYDGETCALLHFLGRRWAESPVMIVATYASAEVERGSAAARLYRAWRTGPETTVIPLGPLTEVGVRELIRDMGHIEHPQRGTRFSRRLFEVTEGNPYYILEVLKALFDQGALVLDSTTGEWVVHQEVEPGGFEMPGTIMETIAQRLQRLPDQLRALLTTVAVGRVGCTPELVADVTGIPRLRVATLCDELVGRQLLVEVEGEYRPAHPLIAEVVRRDLSTSRLTELYRALALAMDRLLPPERSALAGRLARHAEHGGLPDLARRHAVIAAEAAVRHLAFDEALRWLDMAAAQGEATEEIDRLTAEVLRLVGLAEMPASVTRRDSLVQRLDPGDFDLRKAGDESASQVSDVHPD